MSRDTDLMASFDSSMLPLLSSYDLFYIGHRLRTAHLSASTVKSKREAVRALLLVSKELSSASRQPLPPDPMKIKWELIPYNFQQCGVLPYID